MKILAMIPAHLASVRFPRKILFPFYGLPMIEHVRRRALLSQAISDVYVTTCDAEIAAVVEDSGGKVILSSNEHTNGTSRIAEAIKEIDCTHVVLLQGDEPLLLPNHIDIFVKAIQARPEGDAWNATGPIEYEEELDRHSFVKCAVANSGRIMYCFRRTPCFSDFATQRSFIRKILGIIAYRKEFLLELTKLPPAYIEQAELIEQMRIIENGFNLQSVSVTPSLPSVNQVDEVETVLEYINNNAEQKALLEQVLA